MDQETQPKNTVRITIDFDPETNQIGVTGPLENMALYLGMLETAKVVLLEQRAEAQRKAAVPAIVPGTVGLDIDALRRPATH